MSDENKDKEEELDRREQSKEPEEIPYIDLTAEMSKPTQGAVIKAQQAQSQESDENDDFDDDKEQPANKEHEDGDFEPAGPGEGSGSRTRTKSLRGKGKIIVKHADRYINKGFKWLDMRTEFTAEERARLREMKTWKANEPAQTEADIRLAKRFNDLEKEWEEESKLDPIDEKELVEDLDEVLANVNFNATPGGALLFTVAMVYGGRALARAPGAINMVTGKGK